MATKGVLKITTRLAKDKFKQDLKGLTKDIKVVEAETNAMGDGTEAMASGLGASVGAIAKIAVIAALVVGAFVLIKKAVESIVKNNEEVAGKIEAIKNALSNIGQALVNVVANIILPVVEKIVNFIYLILSYVNAITKAWWGYDLFAENASENLASGASSAQAIEKALAGFDTADILGKDNKGTIGGADVKNIKKYTGELKDIPKWLQKIIDSKAKIDVLFSGAKEGAKLMVDYIEDGWEWLKKYNPFIALITGGWESAKQAIDNCVQKVKEFFDNFKKNHPVLSRVLEIFVPIAFFADLISSNWDSIKSAIGKCCDVAKDLYNWFKDIFNKVEDILDDLDLIGKNPIANLGEKVGSSSAVKSGVKKSTSSGSALLSGLFSGAKKIFGVGLASGGIVNNPGPGVPLSQINVGEKGPEAVLPLTDGTLQRLASMIPVQIELTNTIDGRVLSRRLETIRQNNAFSRNGV